MKRITLALVLAAFGQAQTYTISDAAGGSLGLPINVPGLSATLIPPPYGLAVDAKNNIYFPNGNVILRLDGSTNIITVFAGKGSAGYSGDDGLAINAELNAPTGLVFDSAGALYISDAGNQRVRRVNNGIITTYAGNGAPGFSGDSGPAIAARLFNPAGLATDSVGNLYIADTANQRIRRVSTTGFITTVAGSGFVGFKGDGGLATNALLYNPNGVAVDANGDLYVADSYNNRVRKVHGGTITTVAGDGTIPPGSIPGPPGPGLPPQGGFGGDNGAASNAQLYDPINVAVDAAGNLYIADAYNGRIRKVTNGTITTVAGNGTYTGTPNGDNGPATNAPLGPFSLAVDPAGNLYIGDNSSQRIRKVANGIITSLAGTGKAATFFSGDNGSATAAQLWTPSDVAVDSNGDLYIADTSNQRIRKVSNGIITTVAGGGASFGDGGPATSAQLNQPLGVAIDSAGNLYVADTGNNRIRRVTNGIITTVAGTGAPGFNGDGSPANFAMLNSPTSVAVDTAGNVYIGDSFNNRIRKLSGAVITTIAGNGVLAPGNGIPGGRGYGGFSGDGGPAINAQLSTPTRLAVDSAGTVYFADYDNHRIRKITSGTITTIAGSGPNGGFGGFGGDGGLATAAQLNDPNGIAVDTAGNLYISDTGNLRVRKVTNGVITTIAGAPPANVVRPFNYPLGIAVNSAGVVFVADYLNNRIRHLTPNAKPVININGIVPVYSSVPTIQTGSWVSIYGSQLADTTTVWNGDFPQLLGGTSVTIDGKPAFLWVASPTQINLQVPDDDSTGLVSVAVTTAAGTTTSTVTLAPQAPSLSLLPDGRHAAAQILNAGLAGPLNTFSFPTRPVKAGETLVLYGIGFGPTQTAVPAGHQILGAVPTINPVTVTIGGVNAPVSFAGIVQAGLYQINVTVPSAGSGDQPVMAKVNGVQTPAALIFLQQ